MPEQDLQADFRFTTGKDHRVQIWRGSRLARTLKGKTAIRFLGRIEALQADQAQLLMARVTGQFKFGNERMPKR
jgi:hypothetical protein